MAAGQDDQTLMGAGMDTGSLAEANALAGAGWGTFVILGALAGWFTGRTLRTGGLVVAYVLLGVAGALVGGCFILSFVCESASSSVLFTLVTATAGGAVPVWLLQLTVAPSRRRHPAKR
jgi:uncharacterized membrane protein YeaQ/YmgE (transglycosylase-associated protein family)